MGNNTSNFLIKELVSSLQTTLIEKSIFRDDLSKTLDNIRFRYEMSITPLALDCFYYFLKGQELNYQIWDYSANKDDLELYKLIKLEHEQLLNELSLKLKKEKDNHQDVLNNYYFNVLDDEKNMRLNQLYSFVYRRLNFDINPSLTLEELAIWHEAQEKYMENDLFGMERLIQQYNKLDNLSTFDYENLSQEQLNDYINHLNLVIDEIDEEINVYCDPSKHQFWTDMINENDVKLILNEKINSYQNINAILEEYFFEIKKNPK